MVGEIALVAVAVAIAYLLGSIPSAYWVGRLMKGVDVREVGDGRIGAAAAYRRVGVAGGIIVLAIDAAKGAVVVLLAQRLELPLPVVVLCGLAVVVGHNWSILLRFQGGKGAVTTFGVLVTLMFWQFFLAMALGGVFFGITRKTGLCTGILFGILALSNFFLGSSIWLVILPVLLSVPMALKHISTSKAAAALMTNMENPGHKRG